MKVGSGARLVAALALLPCLLALAGPAAAQMMRGGDRDEILPRCGIRWPGGYERNTVRTVQGAVEELDLPASGPVSFRLRSEREAYVVIASPAWYWEEQRIPVRDGDAVQVTGSATIGRDGELYLLARELRLSGGAWAWQLRSGDGRPAWRGCGPGGCGSARVPVEPLPAPPNPTP